MGSDQYARDLLARRDKTIAEARAQIAVLRKALEASNAAMWDGHYGKGIAVEYAQSRDAMVKQALSATPSDCLKQIRAEILDEAFDALPEENFKFVDRDKIKAVFERLKDKP